MVCFTTGRHAIQTRPELKEDTVMLPRPCRHNAPASIDIGVAQTESSAFPLTLGVRITAIPLGDATSPPAALTAESCRQFPAAACVTVNDSLPSVELIKVIVPLLAPGSTPPHFRTARSART